MIVNKNSIRIFRLLADIILLNISYLAAAVIAQSFGTLVNRSYMFVLMLLLNIIWYITTRLAGFYDDFSIRYFAYQFVNIIKSILWQIITAVLFIFIVKEDLFTRNFIVLYSAFLLVLISIRTLIFKSLLQYLRDKGVNVRNLLIIGEGETGESFYNLIKANPDFGYNFMGFVATSATEGRRPGIVGDISQLENILSDNRIEEVVIAFSENNPVRLEEVIRTCNRQAVKIHLIPDYYRILSKKFAVNMIGNYPVISIRNEPLEEAGWRFLKRLFDVIFSFVITVFILSWLIPIIALLIKIDSKGKVFYKQERVGEKNSRIRIYKFRTLRINKDDKYVPVLENDPRITRVGKYLRKSNLDEIPQFINVLKGDMSVVGPRPHALSFNKIYSEMFDEIKMRHNVKPGITGWAQIHGLRGDVADPDENRVRTIKRIRYDLWYIENWTLWLDTQIILITIWQMLRFRTRGK